MKLFLLYLCVLATLLLTNCGAGSSNSQSQSQTPEVQLTVSAPAAGAGTITSTPVGISCPTTCSANFASGTQVTLSASAGNNYFFGGWQGGCTGTSACVLTLTAAASVSAIFNAGTGLTVELEGGGTGTITSNPSGINCPTTCAARFAPNTNVKLTASPGNNDSFVGWSGACTGNSTCSIALSSSNTVTATFGGSLQSINHIIIFAQENRSFDHYFGALRAYWAQAGIPDQSFDGLPQFNPATGAAPLQGPVPAIPGCDPTQPFPASTVCHADTANLISSFHFASVCQEEQSPFWSESHRDWDYNDPVGLQPATLNGFVITAANDARQQSPTLMDTNGIRAMGYFDWTDLNYYYFMASSFATSDRWFSPVMDRTQINRMYLLAATSAGHVHPLVEPEPQLTQTTIFEELQNAGISWRIYVNPLGTSCSSDPTGPCLESYSYINQFKYGNTIKNSPTLSQNIVPISQFTTDVQNGTLPQVALIEPPSNAGLDEHPTDYDTQAPVNVQAGANFASSLINTFMNSPSWTDSAMIFTYDEFGGFYDHVSPQPMPSPDNIPPQDLVPGDECDQTGQTGGPTCDFTWTGYRVPLIVISPYAQKNFVSHQVRDYTAMLKLIEKRFGLAPLTQRDAAQIDMDEFFDFVNKPWAVAPAPPAQIRTGQCTLSPPPQPPPTS
jgi:phospholipase C